MNAQIAKSPLTTSFQIRCTLLGAFFIFPSKSLFFSAARGKINVKKISFETLKDLKKRDDGLSDEEVSVQRARYGKNEIVTVTGHPWLELALDTLKDPMIWFLLSIGTLFIFIGDRSEGITLLVAILPLVFMDAILHWRTQASTASLKGELASKVTVVRSNSDTQIDSHELVPGDLIRITPGLFLPADGVFQSVNDLQVDESVITGEAFPIHKKALSLSPFNLVGVEAASIDPTTFGYAGTQVLTGIATMRVLFTGQRTFYGEIVQSVSKLPHERTPLQKSIAELVQYLILAAAFLCLVLAGVRVFQGHGWLDALISASTLAIAAIPEEFPVVFTFFLGVGIYRLAKRRALVRRAVAVENIGRVTYICTDKTGTITIGLLRLTHIDPVENFTETEVLKAAYAASNHDGSDPVDLAIRDTAAQQKLLPQIRLRTFPFTEDRKQETSLVQETNDQVIAYMKGAPETVLKKSTLNEVQRFQWSEKTTQWARGGHKVLACAKKVLSENEVAQDGEPKSEFQFCGLIAFEDPPRPEVIEAMEYCHRNGISVLMITGDHQDTAFAIAKDVGLGGASPVVASAEEETEKFQEAWLEKNSAFLRGLNVVARCTPLQKLWIVNALKKAGEVVAVTGDGVNDVPALKASDVGIAMGERGTRSAKEVSSIVLADDNFRTIVGAIMEGRQLFTNLTLSFKYLLLLHIPFVLTAAVIPLLGYPLLYLPVHIVWLELVIHPSALFAFQQKASSKDGKARAQRSFFTTPEIVLILLVGLTATVALGFSFSAGLSENSNIGHARAKSMSILTLWSSGLVAYFTRLKTWAAASIFFCTVASSILAVQVLPFSRTLKLSPLHFSDWMTSAGTVALLLLLIKIGDFICAKSGQGKLDK